jgi:prevent-host-death family protein
MKHLGAFEAKTHFSEILGNVIKGEKFIITKHGAKVAMIVPFSNEKESINPIKDAIRAIKKLRKGISIGKKLSIRQMREEGRK